LDERVILILELDTFEGLPFALASTNGGERGVQACTLLFQRCPPALSLKDFRPRGRVHLFLISKLDERVILILELDTFEGLPFALASTNGGGQLVCKLAPCSFNGVHQPSLSKTFAREDVYIFSYFFDPDHGDPDFRPKRMISREL
jgi:hypothetical protein